MKRTGFSDNAVDEDKLGMESRCVGLARFLSNCSMPMTLAIQGDWGTGKSTCMNLIEKHLSEMSENGSETCIIRFNTWQFSLVNDGTMLIRSLLSVMCSRFEELLSRSAEPERQQETDSEDNEDKKKAWTSLRSIKRFAGNLFREVVTETLPGKVVYSIGDAVSDKNGEKSRVLTDEDIAAIREGIKEPEDRSQEVTDLCRYIRELVEKITHIAGIGDRVYVFIDDLDRLRPEIAVEFMECLKNFMDCPGLVFVLAVDKPVVVLGLRKKYGDDFEEAKAQNFFDKIIQVPYLLPVNSYKLDSYVRDFLCGGETDVRDEDVNRYVELLSEFDERNPRTIKRSFNVLQLHEYMMGKELPPEERFRLYALLLLQLLRPRQYMDLTDDILRYMDDLEDLQDKIAESMKSEDPEVQKDMAVKLVGKQRVVLECFRSDTAGGDVYELESLISFIALTKENSSENAARSSGGSITEAAEGIYAYLRNRTDITFLKGWDELTGIEEAQTEISAAARCTDEGSPVRKITVKRQAESDKLNLSVFFNSIRSAETYTDGLEEHFHYVTSRDWDESKPYNCYYSDTETDKRITVARFDEFTPALAEMLDRCFGSDN